jgi:hypothetical protein
MRFGTKRTSRTCAVPDSIAPTPHPSRSGKEWGIRFRWLQYRPSPMTGASFSPKKNSLRDLHLEDSLWRYPPTAAGIQVNRCKSQRYRHAGAFSLHSSPPARPSQCRLCASPGALLIGTLVTGIVTIVRIGVRRWVAVEGPTSCPGAGF